MSLWKIITPEATKNLVTNPSIEIDTSGYVAGINWLLFRVSGEQYKGVFSLEARTGIFVGDPTMFLFSITLPLPNTTYTATAFIKVPTGSWSGGDLSIVPSNYAGSSVISTKAWLVSSDPFDTWFRLQTIFSVSADVIGEIGLVTTLSPTFVDHFINWDTFQVENKDHPTTPCDGDQDGCFWNFTRHASTSEREFTTLAGGVEKDIVDDLGLQSVRQFPGTGAASPINIFIPLGQLDGELYQSTKQAKRDGSVLGQVFGVSRLGLHQKRQLLISSVSHERLAKQQPFIFRYSGAGNVKDLRAVYSNGLPRGQQTGFSESLAIGFSAADPYWLDNEEQGLVLSFSDTIAFSFVLEQQRDGTWDDLNAGTNSQIKALAYHPFTKELHIAGFFTSPTNRIAKFTAGSFVGIDGTDADDNVLALIFGANGDLYIGGEFALVNSVANTLKIAQFNGTAWIPLGTGMSGGDVESLVFDSAGNLYAGGSFTLAGGVANTIRVAKWNGSVWSALGVGVDNGSVLAMVIDIDGNLVVGGTFTTVNGGTTANNLARFNLSTSLWETFPSTPTAAVQALANDRNGNVILGGLFSLVGMLAAAGVAKFNGASFEKLGDNLTNIVDTRDLFVDVNGDIHAAGNFAQTGTRQLLGEVAVFKGTEWLPLPVSFTGPVIANAIAKGENDTLAIGLDTAGSPATISAINTVTNNGTAKSFPIYQFTGPGRIFKMANIDHEQELFFNITLQPGEVATLDTRPSTFSDRRGKSFTSTFRGDIIDAIISSSDLASFALFPDVNKIAIYMDNTTGDTEVLMWWRPRYDSIDGGS